MAAFICSRFKLKWEYLPQESAVLLDKIYKFDHNTTYELGGEAAERVLHNRGILLCPECFSDQIFHFFLLLFLFLRDPQVQMRCTRLVMSKNRKLWA